MNSLDALFKGDRPGHAFRGNQWTGGIMGPDQISQLLRETPRNAGEEIYAWHARVLEKVPQELKHEVLAAIRERYAPVESAAEAAAQYRRTNGLPEPKVDWDNVKADIPKAEAVAKAYLASPDMSNRTSVQRAYQDFKHQTDAMFDMMTRPKSEGGMGLKVLFVDDAEPYKSAAEQADDVRKNNTMKISNGSMFIGADGLGTNRKSPLMTADDYGRFRAVHDYFGHVAVGGGFDRHGEYAAWLMHNSMYKGEGRKAMSSEYHGVNSASWAGKTKYQPGFTIDKAVILPDRFIQSPFDEHGNVVRKSNTAQAMASSAKHLIDALKLTSKDSENVHRKVMALRRSVRKANPFDQLFHH